MRKISFILICILLVLNSIRAQESQPLNFCGTKPGKSQWLIDYQKNPMLASDRTNDKYFVPMTVSILTNDDGSKGYSVTNVLDEICQLNKDFEATGIYFYLSGPVRFIANTGWNNHKDFGEGYGMFENNVNNTVNVYYCSDPAGTCGYDIMGTGIALAKGCMGTISHTWAHEMGHEFSLPHTFVGWEGAAYNPAFVPDSINGYEVELVNKTNCKSAADGFCDTAADYLNSRWDCLQDGKSGNQLKDPKGQTFRVDGTFFMSYSKGDCMNRFSSEQIAAMRAVCISAKKDYAFKDLNVLKIRDSISIISPYNSSLIKPDNVVLNWKKTPNCTHYFYEVARDKSFNYVVESKLTTDTFSLLNNLLFSKDYYWRIVGFNLNSTCRPATSGRTFRFSTDNSFSNTIDVDLLTALKVFPNPVNRDAAVQIQLQSQRSGKIVASLFEMSGRMLTKKEFQVADGENNLTMQNESLIPGIYLLRIEAAQGSIQRKLVVF